MPRILALYTYPIKSLRGWRSPSLVFDRLGPLQDRQWMLIDEHNHFLTLRTHPQLARIEVSPVAGGWHLGAEDAGVTFGEGEWGGPALDVTLFKMRLPAYEVDPRVSRALTEILKQNVRLVRIGEESTRGVRFVDSQSVLMLSQGSLSELERRVGHEVSYLRFRPNIFIDGDEPHAEDTWPELKINQILFTAVKPCVRCRVTQADPYTGLVSEEPLRTLGRYRNKGGITFGHYFRHHQEGEIAEGDELSIATSRALQGALY